MSVTLGRNYVNRMENITYYFSSFLFPLGDKVKRVGSVPAAHSIAGSVCPTLDVEIKRRCDSMYVYVFI